MMLPKITLPATALSVSPFCLGTGLWGSSFRGRALEELFTAFLAAGGNFFDSAHCYAFWLEGGDGASETALGTLVRKYACRSEMVIATKGGHPSGGPQYPRPDRFLSPEVIARDIEESLSRLEMDTIDVFYLHRDDSRVPVSETMDSLNIQLRAGRVRYLGASNWTVARIEEANRYAAAHQLSGFVVSQPQWSLAHPNAAVPTSDPAMRHLTREDIAWHVQHQFPVAPYSSTANGYFAAGRAPVAAFDNPVSRDRLARANALALELKVKPEQIALAYLRSQPFPVIPVLGTTNRSHLLDALPAAAISLTPEQLQYLEGTARE